MYLTLCRGFSNYKPSFFRAFPAGDRDSYKDTKSGKEKRRNDYMGTLYHYETSSPNGVVLERTFQPGVVFRDIRRYKSYHVYTRYLKYRI